MSEPSTFYYPSTFFFSQFHDKHPNERHPKIILLFKQNIFEKAQIFANAMYFINT